jgi:hypothetical protein
MQMRSYDYGTKTLKANAKLNNVIGRVAITTNTSKLNDSQLERLRNKTYYRYKKGTLSNRTRPKIF